MVLPVLTGCSPLSSRRPEHQGCMRLRRVSYHSFVRSAHLVRVRDVTLILPSSLRRSFIV